MVLPVAVFKVLDHSLLRIHTQALILSLTWSGDYGPQENLLVVIFGLWRSRRTQRHGSARAVNHRRPVKLDFQRRLIWRRPRLFLNSAHYCF